MKPPHLFSAVDTWDSSSPFEEVALIFLRGYLSIDLSVYLFIHLSINFSARRRPNHSVYPSMAYPLATACLLMDFSMTPKDSLRALEGSSGLHGDEEC